MWGLLLLCVPMFPLSLLPLEKCTIHCPPKHGGAVLDDFLSDAALRQLGWLLLCLHALVYILAHSLGRPLGIGPVLTVSERDRGRAASLNARANSFPCKHAFAELWP